MQNFTPVVGWVGGRAGEGARVRGEGGLAVGVTDFPPQAVGWCPPLGEKVPPGTARADQARMQNFTRQFAGPRGARQELPPPSSLPAPAPPRPPVKLRIHLPPAPSMARARQRHPT